MMPTVSVLVSITIILSTQSLTQPSVHSIPQTGSSPSNEGSQVNPA